MYAYFVAMYFLYCADKMVIIFKSVSLVATFGYNLVCYFKGFRILTNDFLKVLP